MGVSGISVIKLSVFCIIVKILPHICKFRFQFKYPTKTITTRMFLARTAYTKILKQIYYGQCFFLGGGHYCLQKVTLSLFTSVFIGYDGCFLQIIILHFNTFKKFHWIQLPCTLSGVPKFHTAGPKKRPPTKIWDPYIILSHSLCGKMAKIIVRCQKKIKCK